MKPTTLPNIKGNSNDSTGRPSEKADQVPEEYKGGRLRANPKQKIVRRTKEGGELKNERHPNVRAVKKQ